MDEETQSPRRKLGFDNLLVYVGAVLLLLGIGGGVFAFLVLTRPEPSGERSVEPGPLVRVFQAEKTSHRISVTAYGTTRASEVWTAIAEVQGRLGEVHPRFEVGEILPAGTLLARIDPTDYQLAVMRLTAEATAKGVQLDELDQNEKNLNEILGLQQRQLTLAAAELARERDLLERKAVPRHELEKVEFAYVTTFTAVQKTRNDLALIPVQRSLARASLDAAAAELDRAWHDLDKCEIRLPLDARCASKSIEAEQYVAPGGRLGTFQDLEKVEIVVMLEPRKVPALFPYGIDLEKSAAEVSPGGVSPGGVSPDVPSDLPAEGENATSSLDAFPSLTTADIIRMSLDESLWKRIRVPVEVSWGLDERGWTWQGRVARIVGALDPDTRTIPVIVEVPRPYEGVLPGIRPPLLPDVFCRVKAYGATVRDVVVIPRDALRDDQVYLLRDGKLAKVPVTILAREEELVVISKGIESGDLVVLSDIPLASPGMSLRAELVDNPVEPCRKEFPASLFEDEPPEGESPAAESPTAESPAAEPLPEAGS